MTLTVSLKFRVRIEHSSSTSTRPPYTRVHPSGRRRRERSFDPIETTPRDIQDHPKTPDDLAAYLEAAIEEAPNGPGAWPRPGGAAAEGHELVHARVSGSMDHSPPGLLPVNPARRRELLQMEGEILGPQGRTTPMQGK